jgi:GAF domain-containing protein
MSNQIILPNPLLPLVSALENCPTPASICMALAGLFRIRYTEVALLRLEQSVLRFLYPEHLRNTGAIPISSSAVAAHTALSKKAEIFNNFALVKHATIFEIISPSDTDTEVPLPIQKLMSVPIIEGAESTVLGVIQVSRKGEEPRFTPDFSCEELHTLELAAQLVASVSFFIS